MPPLQVRKGWTGFASGVPTRASPGHPSLTPVLRILGDRMTARGPLRPAKPKTKATCHGGGETRLRRPAGPRDGGAWAGGQVLVSVFCLSWRPPLHPTPRFCGLEASGGEQGPGTAAVRTPPVVLQLLKPSWREARGFPGGNAGILPGAVSCAQ